MTARKTKLAKPAKAKKAAKPARPRNARGTKNARPKKAASAKSAASETSSHEPELKAHPGSRLTKLQLKTLWDHLLEERDAIVERTRRHVGEATAEATPLPEEGDLAQRHAEQDYLLRLADKERKLLGQIQVALSKFETGEYGICEGTEEPIGFKRLALRPWARHSVEYKEILDRQNR